MDQIPLVEEQIRDGEKLVELLNAEGIPVLAAAWIKEYEGRQWYLYLVTPLVREDGGTRLAYARVTPAIRRLQEAGLSIDPFEVKVVSPSEPAGAAIAEVQRQFPGRQALRYGSISLRGWSVEGAYTYPQTR
jgi:hypothetical protein